MSPEGNEHLFQKQEREHQYRVITPEILLSDRDLLKKVYDKLTTKVRKTDFRGTGSYTLSELNERWEPDIYGTIDFGPEFGKVDSRALYFYIAYHTGITPLDSHGTDVEGVINYLKLMYEDSSKASVYLEKLKEERGFSKDIYDFMSKGFNLSDVIPGAPELITDVHKFKHDAGGIDSRPTPKIYDLVSPLSRAEAEFMGKLQEIFADKTVVDFGAGKDINGLSAASRLGAKNYIAVEPYNIGSLLQMMMIHDHAIKFSKDRNEKDGEYHAIDKINLSRTDIKTFLEKLPKHLENVVFVISGIDEFILGLIKIYDPNEKTKLGREEKEKYVDDVNQLLADVLLRTKNGALVIYQSSFRPMQADKNFDIQAFRAYEGEVLVYQNKV